MQIAAVNVGRCCGSLDSLSALLLSVEAVVPMWGVLYVSELGVNHCIAEVRSVNGHRIFIHEPGPGSLPMAFIVNRLYIPFIRKVQWLRRCGSITLCNSGSASTLNMHIVGVHLPSDDRCIDSLYDACTLYNRRHRLTFGCMIGDFNIDLLPTLASDPFQREPHRMLKHSIEREWLESMCDELGCSVHVPNVVGSPPGGPYCDMAYIAPFTRIPFAGRSEFDRPSLLDYLVAPPASVQNSALHWHGFPLSCQGCG